MALLFLVQCNQNHRNLIHLNSLLASHTNSNADPAAAQGALKRPIQSSMVKDKATLTQFNKPVMVVEYEKDAQHLMERDQVEADDPCKLKQGYIGIINRITPFDGKG